MSAAELTGAERALLLLECECGHSINNHGGWANCWDCDEDEHSTCDKNFEALLCERVAIIVEQRVEDRGEPRRYVVGDLLDPAWQEARRLQGLNTEAGS